MGSHSIEFYKIAIFWGDYHYHNFSVEDLRQSGWLQTTYPIKNRYNFETWGNCFLTLRLEGAEILMVDLAQKYLKVKIGLDWCLWRHSDGRGSGRWGISQESLKIQQRIDLLYSISIKVFCLSKEKGYADRYDSWKKLSLQKIWKDLI